MSDANAVLRKFESEILIECMVSRSFATNGTPLGCFFCGGAK